MRLIAAGILFLLISLQLRAQDPPPERPTGLLFADAANYQSIPLATPPLMGDLPARIDMSAKFPRPGNQGQQSSCVGWAVGYGLKSYQEGVERNWSLTDEDHLFSPAFIYNRIKTALDCKGGTSYIEALNLLKRDGIAPLSRFPYKESDCSNLPEVSILQLARSYSIADWRRVNIQDETEVKSHLASGFPVLVGMNVDRAFMSLRGDRPYSQYSGPSRGGHAMVIVGYDDEKNAFKLINSWGADWGDHGFGWINYRALRNAAVEGYVAQDIVVIRPTPDNPPIVVNTNGPQPRVTNSPVVIKSPSVSLEQPQISQNTMVQSNRGNLPGLLIKVNGVLKDAKGKKLQMVVRFAFPNGIMLFANRVEMEYRDATGLVASGTPFITIQTESVDLAPFYIKIPYYALNLQPTGGRLTTPLMLTAFVYLDNFEIARSASVPISVAY